MTKDELENAFTYRAPPADRGLESDPGGVRDTKERRRQANRDSASVAGHPGCIACALDRIRGGRA